MRHMILQKTWPPAWRVSKSRSSHLAHAHAGHAGHAGPSSPSFITTVPFLTWTHPPLLSVSSPQSNHPSSFESDRRRRILTGLPSSASLGVSGSFFLIPGFRWILDLLQQPQQRKRQRSVRSTSGVVFQSPAQAGAPLKPTTEASLRQATWPTFGWPSGRLRLFRSYFCSDPRHHVTGPDLSQARLPAPLAIPSLHSQLLLFSPLHHTS